MKRWAIVAVTLGSLVVLCYTLPGQDSSQRTGERDRDTSRRVERAVAVLQAMEESGVRGVIYFTQKDDGGDRRTDPRTGTR